MQIISYRFLFDKSVKNCKKIQLTLTATKKKLFSTHQKNLIIICDINFKERGLKKLYF